LLKREKEEAVVISIGGLFEAGFVEKFQIHIVLSFLGFVLSIPH